MKPALTIDELIKSAYLTYPWDVLIHTKRIYCIHSQGNPVSE